MMKNKEQIEKLVPIILEMTRNWSAKSPAQKPSNTNSSATAPSSLPDYSEDGTYVDVSLVRNRIAAPNTRRLPSHLQRKTKSKPKPEVQLQRNNQIPKKSLNSRPKSTSNFIENEREDKPDAVTKSLDFDVPKSEEVSNPKPDKLQTRAGLFEGRTAASEESKPTPTLRKSKWERPANKDDESKDDKATVTSSQTESAAVTKKVIENEGTDTGAEERKPAMNQRAKLFEQNISPERQLSTNLNSKPDTAQTANAKNFFARKQFGKVEPNFVSASKVETDKPVSEAPKISSVAARVGQKAEIEKPVSEAPKIGSVAARVGQKAEIEKPVSEAPKIGSLAARFGQKAEIEKPVSEAPKIGSVAARFGQKAEIEKSTSENPQFGGPVASHFRPKTDSEKSATEAPKFGGVAFRFGANTQAAETTKVGSVASRFGPKSEDCGSTGHSSVTKRFEQASSKPKPLFNLPPKTGMQTRESPSPTADSEPKQGDNSGVLSMLKKFQHLQQV